MRKVIKLLVISTLIILLIWVLFHLLYAKECRLEHIHYNSTKVGTSSQSNPSSNDVGKEANFQTQTQIENLPSKELLPICTLKGQLVAHKAYELYYINEAEEAAWVAYNLTAAHINGAYERSNHFEEDPLVKEGSADNEDYAHSGYDRGHLAPAADMSWSQETMQESFYYSNMTPQDPSFNRGKWKELEEQVRDWASAYDYVTVITGPVLTNTSRSIGHDHVIIPNSFYKVIYKTNNQQQEIIAFLMPNQALHAPLQSYVVTVDQLETETGLNFFAAMPDSIENKLEAHVNLQAWDFVTKSNTHTHSTNSRVKNTAQSIVCKGITKAGNPCKNHTRNLNGYCEHHQNQVH